MLAGVTIHNFLVIGAMACVFIVLFKFGANKSGVQGLKKFASAV